MAENKLVHAFLHPKIIETADGSNTLSLPNLNEQYHSVNGAIQESKIVYIQNGLNFFDKNAIKILEIGFGTGLNCLLTYSSNAADKNPKTIDYTAIEPYTISADLVNKLNFTSIINNKTAPMVFKKIHELNTSERRQIHEDFFLTKSVLSVQQFEQEPMSFDLIYYDAFAPSIQPEMWTFELLKKMYLLLKPGGILVTYCAKGEVKRNLKAAGFTLESLPGPPGKREITRARK